MTRMLMSAAYEGSHCGPQCGCGDTRYGRTAQRLREKRQWDKDYFEEQAPEVPDWLELYAAFQAARWGFPLYRDRSEW